MFFRRQKPRTPSFAERIEGLKQAGFTAQPQADGAMLLTRAGCGALVRPPAGAAPPAIRAGILLDGEIAAVVDGGYQKFLQTPSDRRVPALATHLKALHAFEEDLREGLGLTSLYNESLGTTNDLHLYDRIQDRDHGVPRRPWERG
jgi:hypothetical protein